MSDKVEKAELISPEDPSLSLVPTARVNKKVLRLIMGAFGGLAVIAVVISFSPQSERKRKAQQEEEKSYTFETPRNLEVQDSDYYRQTEIEEQIEESSQVTYSGSNPRYEKQVRIPQQEVAAVERTDSPDSPLQQQYSPVQQFEQPQISEEEQSIKQGRESGLFFADSNPVSSLANIIPTARNIPANVPGTNIDLRTDEAKQNQQDEKQAWLASRRADYSIYRKASYTEAIDYDKEITAGTIIPITLITGINSDLPGDIVAQVLSNVYDSYTGRNLLIPKGSKVYGSYDSQITFGQNRVLLVWERIARPDGVTITLGGIQGIDNLGQSGLSDKVDTHIDKAIAAVAAGTIFDTGLDVATAALAGVAGLSTLGDNFRTNSATSKKAMDTYVEKVLNRQPTITIRQGFQANMLLNKNLILPKYKEF